MTRCPSRARRPPSPIPLKERAALVFIERAQLDVKDGAFVAIQADGTRTHIPIGGIACLMLEPGARISHAAVSLAARGGGRWWSGLGRPELGCMPPVNQVEPVRTSSSGKRRLRWILSLACAWFERCIASASKNRPR